MKKILSNPSHIVVAIVAVLGAFATAAYLSFAIFTPAEAREQTEQDLVRNCSTFYAGESVERNTLFDPDKRLVYVRIGENEDFDAVLPYRPENGFSGCSQQAKGLLEEVRQRHEEYLADSCANFKAIINDEKPLPEKNGRKANMQGAIDFVDQYCQK